MPVSSPPADRPDRTETFSGHESFACRYGWLPKLHQAVTEDPRLFSDEESAMVVLGLGKNMVRSIRFWGEALGTTATVKEGVEPTSFGRRLLDGADGRDPYLEDPDSLWRLHWKVVSAASLGAWNVAFEEVRDPQVQRSRLVELVHTRARRAKPGATATTSEAHVDVFIRTYDATKAGEGAALEETLGSPFQELGLVETDDVGGRQVVKLRRGRKRGLGAPAMALALRDHWQATGRLARSMTFRSLLLDPRSPGVAFKLDETTAHDLLAEVCDASGGALSLREDGGGGTNLVCGRGDPLAILEDLAWS